MGKKKVVEYLFSCDEAECFNDCFVDHKDDMPEGYTMDSTGAVVCEECNKAFRAAQIKDELTDFLMQYGHPETVNVGTTYIDIKVRRSFVP